MITLYDKVARLRKAHQESLELCDSILREIDQPAPDSKEAALREKVRQHLLKTNRKRK